MTTAALDPARHDAVIAAPTKISPTVIGHIGELCRRGLTWNAAAELVEPSPRTIRAWRERGLAELHRREEGYEPQPAEDPFVELVETIRTARAQFEADRLARIQQIADGGDVRRHQVTRVTRLVDGQPVTTETEIVEVFRPEWTANAWMLERIIGGSYRRRDRLDVSLDVGQLSADLVDAVRGVLHDTQMGLTGEQREVGGRLLAERLRALVAASEEHG